MQSNKTAEKYAGVARDIAEEVQHRGLQGRAERQVLGNSFSVGSLSCNNLAEE